MIRKPEDIIKIVDKLKGARGNWESLWQECGDYLNPRKNDINNFKSPGEKRNVQILDNTGMVSSELLTGHLGGMLINPASEFFTFTTGNDTIDNNDEVRKYIEKVVKIMHTVLNNTNFQTEAAEFLSDLVTFNTANWTALEDVEKYVIFKTHFIKEIYIKENNQGIVDEVYRVFSWDAKKIIQEYYPKDWKKAPECVQKAYENGKDDKFEIIHAVYPRDPLGIKKKGFNKKIVSQHILKSEKYDMRIDGFNENFWPVARWSKSSGEEYGRGPGINSLPEVKMINLMEEQVIKSAQLGLAPPVQMPDDGFSLPLKIKPYGINYYRSNSNRDDRITPLFEVPRIDFAEALMEQRRQRIRQAFYVDQLQTPQISRQTAYEVAQRASEKNIFLGPLMARLEVEWLSVTVDRVFAILSRRAVLPPAPKILQGKKLGVRFSSVIAKTQKIQEAQSALSFLANTSPLVALDQRVLQNIEPDETLRWLANRFGFPQQLLRDQDELAQMRKQEQDAQARMQELEESKTQSETAKNLAPMVTAVNQTNQSPDEAL